MQGGLFFLLFSPAIHLQHRRLFCSVTFPAPETVQIERGRQKTAITKPKSEYKFLVINLCFALNESMRRLQMCQARCLELALYLTAPTALPARFLPLFCSPSFVIALRSQERPGKTAPRSGSIFRLELITGQKLTAPRRPGARLLR